MPAGSSKNRHKITLVLAVFVLALGQLHSVGAQDQSPTKPGNITISPTSQDLTIGSGLIEAVTKITLTNNTDRDLTATIVPKDFDASGDSGAIAWDNPVAATTKYGLVNWLVLPGGNNVLLPKGRTVQVPVHIENRDDLAPGGHYAGLIVRPSTVAEFHGSHISFKQELISLLFVKKLDGAKFGIHLEALTGNSNHDVPTEVSLTFRSTGNVYVIPRGYVTVSDPSGKTVTKGTINPESNMILPEKSRKLITLMQPITNSNASGKYKIMVYYRYDGQSDFYTASAYYTHRDNQPIKVAAGILTGVIVVVLSYLVRRSRRKHYKLVLK